MVKFARSAGRVPELGRREAERLHQYYIGPEHLLLGLLWEDDTTASRVLRAHGLDVEAVRAEVDRLIAQGVLPGPRPSDTELLATLGIDLEAVYGRLKETFGDHAYYQAAQRVRLRPTHAVPHAPMGGTPLTCLRALLFACEEAVARDQEVTSEHLLLGLLRDAQDPVGTGLYPQDRRLRTLLGLPDHGPHPLRLLVEARGLTLETLRSAVRSELDSDQ
jgi:ATP-dependent Clp protease ATP-binding subunit ClpA